MTTLSFHYLWSYLFLLHSSPASIPSYPRHSFMVILDCLLCLLYLTCFPNFVNPYIFSTVSPLSLWAIPQSRFLMVLQSPIRHKEGSGGAQVTLSLNSREKNHRRKNSLLTSQRSLPLYLTHKRELNKYLLTLKIFKIQTSLQISLRSSRSL